jgi:hypothetical protein
MLRGSAIKKAGGSTSCGDQRVAHIFGDCPADAQPLTEPHTLDLEARAELAAYISVATPSA